MKKSRDLNVYKELINYLNDTLENVIIDFYENKNEFNKKLYFMEILP